MRVDLKINVRDDRIVYAINEARMRNISVTELVERTITMVLQDKMFLMILDDDVAPALVPKLELPPIVGPRPRMTLVDRCKKLVEMIRVRGRLCRADLGDYDEQVRYQSAITKMVDEGVISTQPREPRTRRVYYVLAEIDADKEITT